jgi:hypothetical protein
MAANCTYSFEKRTTYLPHGSNLLFYKIIVLCAFRQNRQRPIPEAKMFQRVTAFLQKP